MLGVVFFIWMSRKITSCVTWVKHLQLTVSKLPASLNQTSHSQFQLTRQKLILWWTSGVDMSSASIRSQPLCNSLKLCSRQWAYYTSSWPSLLLKTLTTNAHKLILSQANVWARLWSSPHYLILYIYLFTKDVLSDSSWLISSIVECTIDVFSLALPGYRTPLCSLMLMHQSVNKYNESLYQIQRILR